MRNWLAEIAILSLFYPCGTQGQMPPITHLLDALKEGDVAFFGRVIETRQVERKEFITVAEATFEVMECYYGMPVVRFQKMQYVCQTMMDASYDVEFPVGYRVIVILNHKLHKGPMVFDSDWKDGIDLAYVLDTKPGRMHENAEKVDARSIYYDRNFFETVQCDSIASVIKGHGKK